MDFLQRTITVEQQLQQTARSGVCVGPPKTKTSYRTVPVPQVVTKALAAHLTAYPSNRFLFTSRDEEPIVRTSFFYAAWRPATKTAGMPGMGMHMMRHTYASTLISAGLSPRVVSERLGHANASLTLNTYSHLWPDDEDRTREAVASWLSAGVPPVCPNEAEG